MKVDKKRCRQCNCEYSETARTWPGCGTALTPGSKQFPVASRAEGSPPLPIGDELENLGYATMGERFLAFLCDASVQTSLLGAVVAAYYADTSFQFVGFKEMAAWIVPPAYLILCETLVHRTLGKRLLGIQLRADSTEAQYPSLFQIFARETVGKFLSAAILGFGFLAGFSNPKTKTWADRLAGTIVVRTRTVSPVFKALLIPVLLCANVGIGIVLTEGYRAYRNQLKGHLAAVESRIDNLHEKIVLSLPADYRPTESYQREITALLPRVDEYDGLLSREQIIVAKSRGLVETASIPDLTRLDVYERVIRLRQEIAELVGKHAHLALTFNPQKQKWDEVLSDRREMIREIRVRNAWINEIGGSFIMQKVAFAGDND
jgi:uncharacterized RDD family membrane protein YckC